MPVFTTEALVPAAAVTTVPTCTVAALPEGPLGPIAPGAPFAPAAPGAPSTPAVATSPQNVGENEGVFPAFGPTSDT